MSKIKILKWVIILIIILIIFSIAWFYLISPASQLQNSEITSVEIVAEKNSLWELGFKETDFVEIYHKNSNANYDSDKIRKLGSETMGNFINTLDKPNQSYYILNKPNRNEILYLLKIEFNENKGITLTTISKNDELKGKFYGWKYEDGKQSKWFIYINNELGKLIKQLRNKD